MGVIVVTNATGGVGSLAIDIFSQQGCEVAVISRKDLNSLAPTICYCARIL